MKKRNLVLSVLLSLCVLVCPMVTNAASGSIFGSADEAMTETTLNGNTVSIKNQGDNTKIYLGVSVTSGTVTEYNATLKLENSNFTYKSFGRVSGWSGTVKVDEDDPTLIHVSFRNQTGVGVGQHLVATINLTVASTVPTTEQCRIVLTPANSTPEPETPKCKQEGDKYYCANGEECTKQEYDSICTTTENPQTGSFLPYAVIVGGLLVAGGLFLVTKKNKIYHI